LRQVNGNLVYFAATVTVSGVTLSPGTGYVMANVNHTAGTFTITGAGIAAANASGGGTAAMAMLDFNKPYAPFQLWGEYAHGIIANPTSWFADGLIVNARPGQGFGWNDGTAIASVTGTEISAGNVSITLTPAGTGTIKVGSAAGLSCSGTPTSGFASVDGLVTHC
jgi:hypothetical protein